MFAAGNHTDPELTSKQQAKYRPLDKVTLYNAQSRSRDGPYKVYEARSNGKYVLEKLTGGLVNGGAEVKEEDLKTSNG